MKFIMITRNINSQSYLKPLFTGTITFHVNSADDKVLILFILVFL